MASLRVGSRVSLVRLIDVLFDALVGEVQSQPRQFFLHLGQIFGFQNGRAYDHAASGFQHAGRLVVTPVAELASWGM